MQTEIIKDIINQRRESHLLPYEWMQTELIVDIIKLIKDKANCQVDLLDSKTEVTVRITPNLGPTYAYASDYLLSFFEADGAGSLGLKIRWTIGKVTNISEVWKSLVLNEKRFLEQGTLFTAIIPKGDEGLFSLVGQMIFPPGTPSEEIGILWFSHAFSNYIMVAISVPGVTMFKPWPDLVKWVI